MVSELAKRENTAAPFAHVRKDLSADDLQKVIDNEALIEKYSKYWAQGSSSFWCDADEQLEISKLDLSSLPKLEQKRVLTLLVSGLNRSNELLTNVYENSVLHNRNDNWWTFQKVNILNEILKGDNVSPELTNRIISDVMDDSMNLETRGKMELFITALADDGRPIDQQIHNEKLSRESLDAMDNWLEKNGLHSRRLKIAAHPQTSPETLTRIMDSGIIVNNQPLVRAAATNPNLPTKTVDSWVKMLLDDEFLQKKFSRIFDDLIHHPNLSMKMMLEVAENTGNHSDEDE